MQILSSEEIEKLLTRRQAVDYLTQLGAPLTYKTLCTRATRDKENPAFEKIGHAVMYNIQELKRYADKELQKKLSPK